MSKDLNSRYSTLFRFIETIKIFEKIYEENKNPDVDFTNFLLKLNIFDNFISSVIKKVDFTISLEIVKKIKLDPDFMLKIIDNMVSENNELFLSDINKVHVVETCEETDNNDNSSISSIEDINSNNSEISEEDNEDEDENQKELSIQTKKLLALSLEELNIRKKVRDYNTIKIEEE